ncbi:serine/threonine-protein kinase tousled-like 2 [Halichondria panicea]|uniref:serine/threonine-protein kinase tousled-like 2 n=1 Tax=Halichondria panicea TaxID=6063 RepID=UPI00312BB707
MEGEGDNDSVLSEDASWIQQDDQDDSFQKLESLDPQKRVQLEARIMGRRGSEVSPARRGSEASPDKSSSCGASRKRGLNNNHSKQGTSKIAKIESFFSPCRKDVCTQSDLTLTSLTSLEARAGDSHDTSLLRQRTGELEQRLNLVQGKLDSTTVRLSKVTEVTNQLLIQKCVSEQKEVRQTSVQNQLRLGRFNNQRQGARFVEVWVDGFAFSELGDRQEELTQQREEIEKQRKMISKRKPSVSTGGNKGKSDDGFTRPSTPSFTPLEYMERDEVLKLRAAALKKEETILTGELEKLERERNLHVRELKRIAAEDSSRFKGNPTLHSRYLLLNLIGRGGFSEVYKAFDLQEHMYVACKIHQLNTDWREDKKANYIKHALREYNIHKKLHHSNIVQLFDVFEIDSNSFCTVLEHIDGHDLDFLLKQNKTLSEKESRAIIIQTISALKYLNEIKPPIIHFDLKPGNILLGRGVRTFEAKITDFGLSKILEGDNPVDMELTSQGAGTYWYLPPECFVIGKDPPKISSKVDVWSVGVIFYQCLYGKKPFGHNLSQASILEQNTILRATEVDIPVKPAVSQEAKAFIRRCLSYNKERRPDVLTLCEDLYLKPKKQQTIAHSSSTS